MKTTREGFRPGADGPFIAHEWMRRLEGQAYWNNIMKPKSI